MLLIILLWIYRGGEGRGADTVRSAVLRLQLEEILGEIEGAALFYGSPATPREKIVLRD